MQVPRARAEETRWTPALPAHRSPTASRRSSSRPRPWRPARLRGRLHQPLGPSSPPSSPGSPDQSAPSVRGESEQVAELTRIVEEAMAHARPEGGHRRRSRSAIEILTTQAFGESMTGVERRPTCTSATVRWRSRTSAICCCSTSTTERVSLDDTIDEWMPELPESDTVTLLMLDQPDHRLPRLRDGPRLDRPHTTRIRSMCSPTRSGSSTRSNRPLQFEPGTNWSYAHTNFMILGHILSEIGGGAARRAAQGARCSTPMGLTETEGVHLVVHPRAGAARLQLGAPSGAGRRPVERPFNEESTLLEPRLGHAGRRRADDDDLRHDEDRDRDRHRRAALATRASTR